MRFPWGPGMRCEKSTACPLPLLGAPGQHLRPLWFWPSVIAFRLRHPAAPSCAHAPVPPLRLDLCAELVQWHVGRS